MFPDASDHGSDPDDSERHKVRHIHRREPTAEQDLRAALVTSAFRPEKFYPGEPPNAIHLPWEWRELWKGDRDAFGQNGGRPG